MYENVCRAWPVVMRQFVPKPFGMGDQWYYEVEKRLTSQTRLELPVEFQVKRGPGVFEEHPFEEKDVVDFVREEIEILEAIVGSGEDSQ